MCTLNTGQLGSEWVLVGVANNSQRGTNERVKQKMILKSGPDVQGWSMYFIDRNPSVIFAVE